MEKLIHFTTLILLLWFVWLFVCSEVNLKLFKCLSIIWHLRNYETSKQLTLRKRSILAWHNIFSITLIRHLAIYFINWLIKHLFNLSIEHSCKNSPCLAWTNDKLVEIQGVANTYMWNSFHYREELSQFQIQTNKYTSRISHRKLFIKYKNPWIFWEKWSPIRNREKKK